MTMTCTDTASRYRSLSRATLVVARSEPHAWAAWLDQNRVEPDAKGRTLVLDQIYFAVQAALDSLGVALAPAAVVAHEIRLGRLVALASPKGAVSPRYALLAPKITAHQEAIDVLAQWLKRTTVET